MSSNDDIWSAADAAEFRRLNRKRMKLYRDKNRVRKYSPRQTTISKEETASFHYDLGQLHQKVRNLEASIVHNAKS